VWRVETRDTKVDVVGAAVTACQAATRAIGSAGATSPRRPLLPLTGSSAKCSIPGHPSGGPCRPARQGSPRDALVALGEPVELFSLSDLVLGLLILAIAVGLVAGAIWLVVRTVRKRNRREGG
jgi:hypothetical protein